MNDSDQENINSDPVRTISEHTYLIYISVVVFIVAVGALIITTNVYRATNSISLTIIIIIFYLFWTSYKINLKLYVNTDQESLYKMFDFRKKKYFYEE
jgi:hypothetical protein